MALTIGASLLGKALGFVRVQQIATTLGVGYHADVLLVSFQLIWLVETVLISNAAVPIVLSRIYRISSEEGSDAAALLFLYSALCCAGIAGLFGLTLWLGADPISAALLPGLEEEARTLFGVLTLTSIATPLALAAGHFLGLINRLNENGVWYSVPQIVTNVVAICGLILGYQVGGAFEAAVGMMAGMVIGALAVCGLQLLATPTEAWAALKLSFRQHRHKLLSLSQAQAFWPGVGALVLAALVQEAYTYVDFYFASSLGEGSVGLVGYASRLATLVNMLFVGSAFVILEPRWAGAITNHTSTAWQHTVITDTLFLFSLLASPVAILFFYGDDVTRMIYGADRFAKPDRDILVQLTKVYSLSIIGISFSMITARLLILLHQARFVLLISLLILPVKLLLATWLVGLYGLPGLAVSTLAALLLQGSCNAAILVNRGLTLGISGVIRLFAGFSIILAIAVYLMPSASSGPWGLGAACATLCVINVAFAGVSRYFDLRENQL